MSGINNRSDFIDYAKALAIISVIILHSLTEHVCDYAIINYTARMAVPIFVIVSGFNFSNSIVKLNSEKEWYSGDRVKRKLASWLFPMLGVFFLWSVIQIFRNPDFSISIFLRNLALQEYGMGAYYFFIVIELYFMFPVIYHVTRRGGILA